jgi:predicted HTH domain antitoxin
MERITLELDDAALAALEVPISAAAEELRLLIAMKLYELERLSAGAAAHFAGLSVPEFLSSLSKYNIDAFRQSPPELEAEVRNAARLR